MGEIVMKKVNELYIKKKKVEDVERKVEEREIDIIGVGKKKEKRWKKEEKKRRKEG